MLVILLAGCNTPLGGGTKSTATLYVSLSGSAQGTGAQTSPLRTIQEAFNKATANRAQDIATDIILAPGTYRQGFEALDPSTPGTARITIEASTPGQSVISGADVWPDWTCSSGICQHAWPYAWGAAPNPWPGQVSIGELALRRELVVFNGVNLTQELSLSNLVPGSFYVDEGTQLIYLDPPTGSDVGTALIEVGVRPYLFLAHGFQYVTLNGLVLQDAASPFGQSAVEVGGNSFVEDTRIIGNGNTGLSISGDNVDVENSHLDNNGADGLRVYKSRNLVLNNVQTSYNNWRGYRGGYDDYDVGEKMMRVHGAKIRNLVSEGNLSRGLWFDYDNENIVIDGLRSCGNLLAGLDIEASQGPISVTGSTLCDNGGSGLIANGSNYVSVTDTSISGNSGYGVHLVQGDRTVDNWETGQQYVLNVQNWTLTGNTVQGAGSSLLWWLQIWDATAMSTFLSSSAINDNIYAQPNDAQAFEMSGYNPMAFSQWQSVTHLDASSTFSSVAIAAAATR